MSMIFNDQNIQIREQVSSWQEALKIASKPLLDSHKITNTYVKNMAKSVKENGPYMVLTDYFALMHARPGEGVNQIGMSLLVLKHPVDLEGKPVKIFLVMAALDNTSHLNALKRIMNILMNNKSFNTILNGNKKEIIDLFKEGEKV
ncbi:PTS sugar transporter subunit IIA [Lactobacillus crispatus]|uniref:PTS sugar transporter subunit IIA n=1 Tax=Lactobacillus crispatus TaxID=47770 RepID=UPI0022E9411B|nr:PTS sugar transporter subunit IIA [Lactobacillus crispatus]